MPRIVAFFAAASWVLIPAQGRAWVAKETRVGATVRWVQPAVALRLSDAVLEHFGPDGRTALEDAAQVWLAAPSAPILSVFTDTCGNEPDSEDGINGVYLPETWTYEQGRLAVTLATYHVETGEMLDADVVLNPAYFPRPRNRYALDRVLSHEFGHILGLDESNAPDSTMWPAIPGGAPLRPIADDDLSGVIAIYGEEPQVPAFTLCAATPSAPALPEGPLSVLLAAVFMRGLRRARR